MVKFKNWSLHVLTIYYRVLDDVSCEGHGAEFYRTLTGLADIVLMVWTINGLITLAAIHMKTGSAFAAMPAVAIAVIAGMLLFTVLLPVCYLLGDLTAIIVHVALEPFVHLYRKYLMDPIWDIINVILLPVVFIYKKCHNRKRK